ncbi:sarcolemmal membrane-associated protein-like [Paramacrobiotus metropolitanus]|uniref:sarcolemmal membrane-associated protein-like n=1 Tax=Paramacrobiotus metropolitanus TaxID=2943436 RepID=UPI002445C6D3|nr:sarcolemmal membrane-associated protein-like [Paramacrobiotus metropolitanus]
MAKVILQCRQQSHQFTDREIPLAQPVKIGRAVANCKPNVDNGFFNCKVLSRNHALLWYEDGKFYLQDTQSSNGTFVNTQKLPATPAPPTDTASQNTLKTEIPVDTRRELFSGDLIQFGVEVQEQAKKGVPPVTHGCIIATARLFHPDGVEAKTTTSKFAMAPGVQYEGVKREDQVEAPKLTVQEVYELQSILQEAHHREHVLESKLVALNRILVAMERKDTWSAMFREDLLLSKIQFLQTQLQACEMQLKGRSIPMHVLAEQNSVMGETFSAPSSDGSQDVAGSDNEPRKSFLPTVCDNNAALDEPKEAFTIDWKKMLDERSEFEASTKKTLHNAYTEKLEAVKALAVAEEKLAHAQNECDDLTAICESTRKDLLELVDRFEAQTQDLDALTKTYQDAERIKIECLTEIKAEKSDLEEQLKDLHRKYSVQLSLCDDLVDQNRRLRDKLDETKENRFAVPNHYDRITGDVTRNNGYSGGSEDEDGLAAEEYEQHNQPAMDNIFHGKNVAQLLQEFGGKFSPAKPQKEMPVMRMENQRQGDGGTSVVHDMEFSRGSGYMQQHSGPPPYEAATNEPMDGDYAKASSHEDNDVEQLISANENLTEIVIKLQAELAQRNNEREDGHAMKGTAVGVNTADTATSTDGVSGEASFLYQGELSECVLRRRNYSESQLSEVLDELNSTATLAQSAADGVYDGVSTVWNCRDPGAIVALMLLVLWLIFLIVFA